MTDEEVSTQYMNQLLDLKMNSKPVINVLTMMAEDYIRQAPIVVQSIEKHLSRVHPGVKLPALYLIDSIVKNVKKEYTNLFTQNIVSTFCGVFEKVRVDDKVKQQMFKLRQTWNDVFPQRKLYAIDVRCHQHDKNWPISSPPSNSASIHVNPKFLNNARPMPVSTTGTIIKSESLEAIEDTQPPVGDVAESQMRETLLLKKKELLELQQKKIELELMQTKAALETKRLVEMESAMKQEKLLMQQAEKAKSKTDIVNHILSSFPQNVPPTSTSGSNQQTSTSSALTSVVHDPRLLRQMENKARSDDVANKSRISRVESTRPAKSKISLPEKATRTAQDSSEVSKKLNIVPIELVETKAITEIEDSQSQKKNHDVIEIDMFGSHSRSHKRSTPIKDRKDGRGKEVHERKSSSKERTSRDRSRSLDRSRSTSRSKEKKPTKDKVKKEVKVEPRESDDDYEDEMKGYSGLTIKPKRTLVALTDAESKELAKRSAGDPEAKSNSHKDKRRLSPFHRTETDKGSRSGTPGTSQSIPSSSQSSICEDSSGRSGESLSKSPQKRRRSSERSDKEKKEQDIKHVSKTDKKDYKGRNRYDENRSLSKRGAKSHDKDASAQKGDQWVNYTERTQAVLKRNYRKSTGVEIDEEENKVPQLSQDSGDAESSSGDVDLRFQGLKDVDLRREVDASQGEPPSKKTRAGGNTSSIIDDLFGREDVDLRQPRTGSWSQMKKPSSGNRHRRVSSQEHDEDIREILQQQNRNRPPPAISPAHSIGSGRSSCDPLGRPLLYDKLPDDPEERKRSLDSRSHSIDPVEQFRIENIDRVLNAKGELSQMDVKNILLKAQEHHTQGIFNSEQYMDLMKRISQINEASAIREVQQMQMRGSNWSAADIPNPWSVAVAGAPTGPGLWPTRNFQPRGPMDSMPRFPIPGTPNTWGPQQMNMGAPWNAPLPRPSGPNPFEEALIPHIDDLIPGVNEMEVRAAEMETASTIPIDKVMRQLRFYGETAIVLMGAMADEPKEIIFQKDGRTRTVLINGKPMDLTIGEVKRLDINRKQHTLKIGAPTRELYIDDRHYEVCFNGPPVRIHLDNRMHTFQLTGPPPQVEVGKVSRYDLMAGRVNLNIDAAEKFAVYLDEKPQKLDLFAEPVILRFCENFRTVLLNGRPFPTNFGARLPFSITVPGAGKHFFRFLAVSLATENSIMQFVRAKQGGRKESDDFNPNGNSESYGQFRGRGRGIRGRRGFGPRMIMENYDPGLSPVVDRNPLDMLTNLFPSPNMGKVEERKRKMGDQVHSYESEFRGESEPAPVEESNGGTPNIDNILALAKSLGFNFSVSAASTEVIENESPPLEEKPAEVIEEKIEEISKPKVPPLETVDVTFNDNLKERRSILVAQLWTGVQCASCGLRFPPDQTVRYSQHLDWHFRFNRREKGNHKKAQSRKWYYDLSDWIQFEEVEDLEERAASLFELPEEGDGTPKSPNVVAGQEKCTVRASGHEKAKCPQCDEPFCSYYDEDHEEWRLEDALLDEIDGETKVYHPVCHQDYLKSLVEESAMEVDLQETNKEEPDEVTPEAQDEEDDEVLILKEGKKEVVLMEIDVDDDEMCGKNSKETIVVEIDENINEDQESENGPSLNTEKKNENADNSVLTSAFSHSIYSKSMQSPIVINDDSSSNLLPGICDDSSGGVFGFALNSGILSERSDSPTFIDEKKIVYERMKFDFPKIKAEPVDRVQEEEPQPDLFLESQEVVEQEAVPETDTPNTALEPVNIDLTDDNSMDEVDSGVKSIGPMTAIDGNLQHDESGPIHFIPPTKMKINISGVDVAASKSPKAKPGATDSPALEISSTSPLKYDTAKGSLSPSEKGGESPDCVKNDNTDSKNNLEIVFTEEMKRLKPRLVGRKLVNCPPKQVGKEESGLCVIC